MQNSNTNQLSVPNENMRYLFESYENYRVIAAQYLTMRGRNITISEITNSLETLRLASFPMLTSNNITVVSKNNALSTQYVLYLIIQGDEAESSDAIYAGTTTGPGTTAAARLLRHLNKARNCQIPEDESESSVHQLILQKVLAEQQDFQQQALCRSNAQLFVQEFHQVFSVLYVDVGELISEACLVRELALIFFNIAIC